MKNKTPVKTPLAMEVLCSLSRLHRAPLDLLVKDMNCPNGHHSINVAIAELRSRGFRVTSGNDNKQRKRVAWIEGNGVAEFNAAQEYWEAVYG